MRLTAKKCRIGHLNQGNFVQKEGWDPSYVETSIGQVSRVNIMAIVVSKEENSIILDDGSGRISVRSFEGLPLMDFEVGDKVNIIAKPRFYNNAMYLVAEIVKKIENDKWLEYRKRELESIPKIEHKVEFKVAVETLEETKTEIKTSEDIITRIKELDKGDGADMEELSQGFKNSDKILTTLMEEGEIFEVKPGKVKVLD
ncbi:hypothetical protein ACFL1B_02615 [Nanoarchaeota archaeon]